MPHDWLSHIEGAKHSAINSLGKQKIHLPNASPSRPWKNEKHFREKICCDWGDRSNTNIDRIHNRFCLIQTLRARDTRPYQRINRFLNSTLIDISAVCLTLIAGIIACSLPIESSLQ
jgi:hypothetical protein